MLITEHSTILQVQTQFEVVYPFLKIEFFSVPYEPHIVFPRSKMFPSTSDLKKCILKNKHLNGKLKLESIMLAPTATVGQIEQQLWDKYGLSAKIFRKSGNSWIATTLTTNWSLARQNLEGEQLSFANIASYLNRVTIDKQLGL